MRIELSNLEGGVSKFANVYQPSELDLLDDRVGLSGAVAVTGTIKRSGSQVLVTGHIEAQVKVECDRCLKQVERSISTDFAADYITGEDYESTRVAELGEEDLSLSVFDGEAIDIDDVIREQVLLATPTRALCSENCKGFCPTCGADLNAGDCSCETDEDDPRWAALKDLVSGKS